MGTIKEKLEYLNETKREIRRALISRNVSVGENETFRSYADKIRNIPVTAEVDVEPLKVTENGEYEAREGHAYNPITVEVKPKLKTLTAKKNGTFKIKDEDGEYDGYSDVTVDVSSNLMKKVITSEDLPDELEKVIFKPSKEDDAEEHPDRIGYSEIELDLDGKFQTKEVTISDKTFGEQAIYEAKDDGLYGYNKFIITYVENDGPFTVKFYDGHNLEDTVTVEHKGGTAVYTGRKLGDKTKRFVKWDPSPYDVRRDLECYAVYEDITEEDKLSAGQNVGNRSWGQIVQNGGADIPIGAWKYLMIGPYSYDDFSIDGITQLKIYKVASGEDGTTSTWVSATPLAYKNGGYRAYNHDIFSNPFGYTKPIGWSTSLLYTQLMGALMQGITQLSSEQFEDNAMFKNIPSVKKKSREIILGDPEAANATDYVFSTGTTNCQIWIPSSYEMMKYLPFYDASTQTNSVNATDETGNIYGGYDKVSGLDFTGDLSRTMRYAYVTRYQSNGNTTIAKMTAGASYSGGAATPRLDWVKYYNRPALEALGQWRDSMASEGQPRLTNVRIGFCT